MDNKSPNKNLEDDDEESEEEEISEQEKNTNLLLAAKQNRLEDVIIWIDKGAAINYEEDGWNPILWAACNGNEKIVRTLIQRGGLQPYVSIKKQGDDQTGEGEHEIEYDPFVKPMNAKSAGRYTPLHWACYKGHYKVVWILLKADANVTDFDMYGNNAIHQASAAGQLEVLKCFMQKGTDVDVKNARLHTPLELATDSDTKKLLNKAMKTKNCQNCKSKFDFKNLRYLCTQSDKFYCRNCCSVTYEFETWESEEKERIVCRSLPIQNLIKDQEKNVISAIDAYDFYVMDKALADCQGIDIDCKLRKRAEVLHLKLDHELKIKTFLNEKNHHDSYKDIRKDCERINKMVETAQNLDIELDSNIVKEVNGYTSRLISERNLRKQRDLFLEYITSSDHDKVNKLQGLIDKATEHNVEGEYIANAQQLTSQMAGNIKARETLQMLIDYPEREYPEPEDPNDKKKDKKGAPKKKKKGPAFPTPPWAEDITEVESKVSLMRKLVNDKKNLKLDDGFIERTNEQLTRFKREIDYRKEQDELARLESEARLAKKKAKKK